MTRLAVRLLRLVVIAPGFFGNFSPKNHKTSKFVDLTITARDGKFLR
jgi:hypothetical protein